MKNVSGNISKKRGLASEITAENLEFIASKVEAVLSEKQSKLEEELKEKQDKLTFDETPTEGSKNPVTSGGVKEALDEKADKTKIPTKVTDLEDGKEYCKSDDLEAVTSRVDEAEKDIDELEKLKTSIDEAEEAINDLNADISGIIETVSGVDGRIEQNKANITDLSSNVTKNTSDIAEINEKAETAEKTFNKVSTQSELEAIYYGMQGDPKEKYLSLEGEKHFAVTKLQAGDKDVSYFTGTETIDGTKRTTVIFVSDGESAYQSQAIRALRDKNGNDISETYATKDALAQEETNSIQGDQATRTEVLAEVAETYAKKTAMGITAHTLGGGTKYVLYPGSAYYIYCKAKTKLYDYNGDEMKDTDSEDLGNAMYRVVLMPNELEANGTRYANLSMYVTSKLTITSPNSGIFYTYPGKLCYFTVPDDGTAQVYRLKFSE